MFKCLAVAVTVVVLDVLLLSWPLKDVDQVGVSRAYAAYSDNPTKENLRIRDERFAAASRRQRRNAAPALVGVFLVTSGGVLFLWRQHRRRSTLTFPENGTPHLTNR